MRSDGAWYKINCLVRTVPKGRGFPGFCGKGVGTYPDKMVIVIRKMLILAALLAALLAASPVALASDLNPFLDYNGAQLFQRFPDLCITFILDDVVFG